MARAHSVDRAISEIEGNLVSPGSPGDATVAEVDWYVPGDSFSPGVGVAGDAWVQAQGDTTPRTLGIDPDSLIAAAPEPPAEGLLLLTRKNSWSTAPTNHEELVRCVEEESYREVGWSGAGVVSQIDQEENIYGNDDSYTSYYEAFFYADSAGYWSFAIDSAGAAELEIEGEYCGRQVVASWYGAHGASGEWGHSGRINLAGGSYYRIICRQAAGEGAQAARAAFKRPGDTGWRTLGESELDLRPVNLEEGLMLVTRKNTWSTSPADHDELVRCVEQDSIRESGWSGASMVLEIYQDENIHGSDDNYTSYYEAFFYVDTAGTWWFATDSAGASEVEVDGSVVASWYGSHDVAESWAQWSHGGTMLLGTLGPGWHRLVYRHAVGEGPQAARLAFMRPGETEWQPFHISRLPLKGVCYMGVDGDGLPESVEAVLGTDPETSDTDGDMLDDYYEAKNGLDPLEPDCNNDGLADYYEVTDVPLDIDGDGTPNAWDPDNDGDGVVDGLDMSPFAKTVASDEFHFQISTGGDPTYIDFQVRPEDPDHLKLPLQSWDWPYDAWGDMQDTDGSQDDVRIVPMLELTMNQFPDQSELDDYGIVISHSKGDGITPTWSAGIKEGGLGDSNAGGGTAMADINGNGRPDLVLMGVDNPSGSNSFWYTVGWDLKDDGTASSWSPVIKKSGLGDLNAGGGAAIADINGNGRADLVLMAIDNPSGSNSFWYTVGWDLKDDGTATSWSPIMKQTGLGYTNFGGGAEIADINGSGRPDLVLMAIDYSSKPNPFWYTVGWDLKADGTASSWSPMVQQAGLGDISVSSGGGAAIADIDGRRLDLVLMAIDNPAGSNSFWYKVGWELRTDETRAYVPLLPNQENGNIVAFTGRMFYPGGSPLDLEGHARFVWMVEGRSDQPAAEYWSSIAKQTGLSPRNAGGGTAMADINGNGRPDIVLMGVDNPSGNNSFWYKVGWDLDINGTASSWSPIIKAADLGQDAICGGAAMADINGNGRPDLVLMAILAPFSNSFLYRVGWDLKDDGAASSWSPVIEIEVEGLRGMVTTGGGAAITDINGNGRPDLLLLGIAGTYQGSAVWYRWAWDLNSDGTASSLSPTIIKEGRMKYFSSGGGADIADINGNGKPDLLVMGVEDSSGHNWFWYSVGWDLDFSNDGKASGWSSIIRREGVGQRCAGGGAAVGDIDGDAKLDLLLMAINDSPEGKNWFFYTIGSNIETGYLSLAKYREDFMLTGFVVEEDQGVDAGLFFDADANQTTRAYLALRYLFLDSQDTLAQAAAELPQYNIAVTADVRHFAHGDEALKELASSMVMEALQSLPQGKVLPVAFATTTTSRAIGMDSFVTSSCTLGDTFDVDLSEAPAITMKAIKLPWYDTATGELLAGEGIIAEVASWGWSADESANMALLLLFWSLGETNMTSLGTIELQPPTPEMARVVEEIAQNPAFLNWLRVAMPVSWAWRGAVYVGTVGLMSPVLWRYVSQSIYATFRTFLRAPVAYGGGLRGAILAASRMARDMCDWVNAFNPLRRAFRSLPRAIGQDTARPVLESMRMSNARYVRFLRLAGRVMIVAAVLAILAEFIIMAASEGWSAYGLMAGGLYAAMELLYLGALIAIACIPVVGWVIALLVIVADVVASIFGYGSAWLMQKLIEALTKFKLRTGVDLQMRGTSSGVVDYDDNGITVGDLIESRSRMAGLVTRTERGTNADVAESYIAPQYKHTVTSEGYGANAVRVESWSSMVSVADRGSSKEEVYDLGVRVKSSAPVIGAPLVFVRCDANYDISYDQCILGVCSPKRYADVVVGTEEGLSFDILPNSIDDFITWSAISKKDSDLDRAADSVEGIAGLEHEAYYRLVNKASGLCLAADEVSGPDVRVIPYTGDNGQQWRIGADRESALYLTAWNGKYVSADLSDYAQYLVAVSDSRSPTERFELVYLSEDKVALRAWNGKYVSTDNNPPVYELLAVADQIGEKERFEVVDAGDNKVALRAWNGKYVSAWPLAATTMLLAAADEIGDWQKFTFNWYGGHYALSTYTQQWQYLTIAGGSLAEGAKAGYVADQGADYQRWAVEPVEEGYYKIVARHSGQCLTAASTHWRAAVVQQTYAGAEEQKWRLELVGSGTARYNRDTDADGLADGFELYSVVDLRTSPYAADTDGDGLNDKLELELGTNPAQRDTDSDALSDYEEYRGWPLTFPYHGIPVTGWAYPDPLRIDSDGDGLTDYEEYRRGLNPRSSDTNGDGIADCHEGPAVASLQAEEDPEDTDGDGLADSMEEAGWDITITTASGMQTIQVNSDPWLKDTDFDGLSDSEEQDLHSNPRDGDTDGDGLGDSAEEGLSSNIAHYDSDGDGLSDSTEVTIGSDPLKVDTDGDGVGDLQELELGCNPTRPDSDADGLTDSEEIAFGSSLVTPDTDRDSLLDSQEKALGTDASSPDSDGDNLLDGYEVGIGTDPLSQDSDADGLEDGEEQQLWTDPLSSDSDDDGLTDFQEVRQYGTNPLSADSDDDGISDALDSDTTTPFVDEICVLYDGRAGSYSGFIDGLSKYATVTHGTLESIPDYQDRGCLILLGYPEAEEGTVGNITYDLLSAEARQRMLQSPYLRLASAVNVWPENEMVIMLSQPYHGDHWRALAMLKRLESEKGVPGKGLAPWAWAGIGVGIAMALLLLALFWRRRRWALAKVLPS
jgi:hypothetical protein